MTQDKLKQAVAHAAIRYVVDGEVVGVGTGSTANFFIDALGEIRHRIKGAVASSEATAARLAARGVTVFDLNQIDQIPVYIDGADEIDHSGAMIKGGGGALTREKIVASVAEKFICIADQSKLVDTLGKYPLPVEVIPMATSSVMRSLRALDAEPVLRMKDGVPYVTDNHGYILDLNGLQIRDPKTLEQQINQLPGVVSVGLFALKGAAVCLLGTEQGVRTITY
ncbi:MAG: ribose-5-phosphate isomerase RpiA [Betaproteobacteria bacterium]|nr:ribose-5-phosphate isomerase RpiA [Betaproteobacteria bacterium]